MKSILKNNTKNYYMNQLIILNSLNEIVYIKHILNILYEKAFIKCVIKIRRYKKININLNYVLFHHIVLCLIYLF